MSHSKCIIKFYIELGLNQQASICLEFGVFFNLKYWFSIRCSPVIQYVSWLQFYFSLQCHVSVLPQCYDGNDYVPAVLSPLIYLNLASVTRMAFSTLTPPFRLIILSLNPHSISSFFWKTKARDTFILEPNLSFIPILSFFQWPYFFYDDLFIRFKKHMWGFATSIFFLRWKKIFKVLEVQCYMITIAFDLPLWSGDLSMTVTSTKFAGWACDIARQHWYLNATPNSERLFHALTGSDGRIHRWGSVNSDKYSRIALLIFTISHMPWRQ